MKYMSNKIINKYLKGDRLPAHEYEDFKIVHEAISEAPEEVIFRVFDWFRWFHERETFGWRNIANTQNIALKLANATNLPIYTSSGVNFYALFCPSYKKGKGASGFRTDDVGSTTLWGIKTLHNMWKDTKKMGFTMSGLPVAVFFDLAVEQPDKVDPEDLEKNIANFRKHLPSHTVMQFRRLSELYPDLKDIIGFEGVKINPLPIPEVHFNSIVERGYKFYKRFGWTKKQVIDRSETIASSEALVGYALRRTFAEDSIMVYTPTMMERSYVYHGKDPNNPIPIIHPKHDDA